MGMGLTDYPLHEKNPYLGSLVIPTRNKTVAMATGKQIGLFDRETGELLDDTAFMGYRRRVDTEEFVKIYKAEIRALFDLSPRAMKVFGYFMDASRISDHVVIFELPDCMDFTGYKSKASISQGVAELLEKEFIARSRSSFKYFLNPAKFFNGDRLVMMREVVKKGSRADKALREHDPWGQLNQGSLELPEPANSSQSEEEAE